MTNENSGPKRTMAMDGHRPLPSQTKIDKGYQPQPGKVQGGYQAPGGGKPQTPTTGSGVKSAPEKK